MFRSRSSSARLPYPSHGAEAVGFILLFLLVKEFSFQKTIGVSRGQYLDKVVDVPVAKIPRPGQEAHDEGVEEITDDVEALARKRIS